MPTLTDGTEVASDSYEWRLECLARYVARMPTIGERQAWLLDCEKRHGKKAADELKACLSRVWSTRESTDTTTGGKA